MSGGGWKEIVKSGWHPEKDGFSLKDQVKGLVGRAEKSDVRESHVPPPITSLRDPSSFGPPPKHVAAYGPASPHTQTSSRTASPSSASYTSAQSQKLGGAGVAGQAAYSSVQPYQGQQAQAAEETPPPEPKPYRVDTTGLSIANLPPPPGRRDGSVGLPPPPRAYSPVSTTVSAPKPKGPPSLPPRLPPRSGNSSPSPSRLGAQVPTQTQLNQGAIDRLGAAGISVPGLGIGGGKTTGSPAQAPVYKPVDELQARFAHLGSSPAQDSNVRTPAEEIRPGFTGQSPSVLGKKKPPPPPPKKPAILGAKQDAEAPPPIPLATRPKFR